MPRPPHSLLVGLILTTLLVSAVVTGAGWRLLVQQRAIDERRAHDQAESAADAAVAGMRSRLAEAGERLSTWVSNPTMTAPPIDDAVVVVGLQDGRFDVNPTGGLPFVPGASAVTSAVAFGTGEAAEFRGDLAQAAAAYETLAADRSDDIKAGALVRLARVQRKSREFDAALATYRRLEALGGVVTDGIPAELAAWLGIRSIDVATGDERSGDEVSPRILGALDGGRWQISRGPAELYRESFTEPKPPSWRLAAALAEIWPPGGSISLQGQRLVTDPASESRVLVMWRSNGVHTAAFAAHADRWLDAGSSTLMLWQLVDPEGKVIAGVRVTPPTRTVSRIIGNSEYPWTLHTWMNPSTAEPRGHVVLLWMMAAMLAFVWAASYFMAKAIRREAAVARLQSDFVAAVSHEFRSPLTAVRQMAEMLLAGRVATDERRHTYYQTLAAEATRLQGLVETLLDFGRLEAGAERYRFLDLGAAALVREVVDDIAPHARQSGTAVELDGLDDTVRIRADRGALAVAVRNLIDNAIKYSPGQPAVRVQCRKDRDRAAIRVIDSGVGIPASEQQAIFGKFVRGRAAVDANIKGTGVGLAVVQRIVVAHGGEIVLESQPGRGSTFTLLLPAVN